MAFEAFAKAAAIVVVVAFVPAGGVFDDHAAAAVAATQQPAETEVAGRAAGMLPAWLEALLHRIKQLFGDDAFVGRFHNPVFLGVGLSFGGFIVNALADVGGVFHHIGQAGCLKFGATVGVAAVVQAAGDADGAFAAGKAAEDAQYLCFFNFVRDQFAAFAIDNGLVAQWRSAAVEIAFFGIFQHGAFGVAADLAGIMLVHDFHE